MRNCGCSIPRQWGTAVAAYLGNEELRAHFVRLLLDRSPRLTATAASVSLGSLLPTHIARWIWLRTDVIDQCSCCTYVHAQHCVTFRDWVAHAHRFRRLRWLTHHESCSMITAPMHLLIPQPLQHTIMCYYHAESQQLTVYPAPCSSHTIVSQALISRHHQCLCGSTIIRTM